MRMATNIAIALLIIVWFAEGGFKNKSVKFISSPLAVASVLLFFLYLFGLLYTGNMPAGYKYLETKASLLIFPIILSTAKLKKENLSKTLYFFSWCCVLFSLVAFLYQIKVVNELDDINYLFSDGLVLIYSKQAVYYSIYVAFSILVLLAKVWFEYASLGNKKKALFLVSISFLFLILFLLASRTSLAVLLMIVFTTAIIRGIRKGKLGVAITSIISLLLFISSLSYFFPQTIARFDSLKNLSFNFQNKASEYHFAFANTEANWNGLNLRLAKWVCAIDVIKENPVFGVGTGDIKDELVNAYLERDFFYAAEKRFDPHNQFFETTVGIGTVGLALVCIFYFYPLYAAVKRKKWLFTAFSLLIIFCSLTETVLSSSQGIIFICFFMFIFTRIVEEDSPLCTS